MQRRQQRRPDTPVDEYLQRIALKTGKLFEAVVCWARATSDSTLRAAPRHRVPDRRRHPRLHGRDAGDGQGDGDRPAEGTPTLPLLLAAAADPVVRRRSLAGRSTACSSELLRAAPWSAAAGSPWTTLRTRAQHWTACPHARSWKPLPRPSSREGAEENDGAAREDIHARSDPGEGRGRRAPRLRGRLALLETDDLLALGELADLARRRRGGTDDVYFVQNLYLNQTNVCRVVQVLRLRRHVEAVARLHDVGRRTGRGRPAPTRADGLHRDPHRQRGEPARHVRVVRRHDPVAEDGAAGRAPQVLHGVRDPPHDHAVRAHTRGGAARAEGGWARLAHRWRRGGLRRPRTTARRPGKEHPDFWFLTHDTAHRLGIPTHCTMLYGHVETYEERVDTSSACASSRTVQAASSPSSCSPSIPRTRCSSAAAGGTRPARTT